jgi:predicted nucleic acid-binding protein
MIYLDSYVFLDILSGKKELVERARKFLVEAIKVGYIVSSVVLTEVIYHLLRKGKVEESEDFLVFIESSENLKVVDVNKEIAVLAAKLRNKYYKKGKVGISYLDCIHLATAIVTGCSKFVTGDKDFEVVKEIKVEIY